MYVCMYVYSMPYKAKDMLLFTCWSTSVHEINEMKIKKKSIIEPIHKMNFITAIIRQSKFILDKLASQFIS